MSCTQQEEESSDAEVSKSCSALLINCADGTVWGAAHHTLLPLQRPARHAYAHEDGHKDGCIILIPLRQEFMCVLLYRGDRSPDELSSKSATLRDGMCTLTMSSGIEERITN